MLFLYLLTIHGNPVVDKVIEHAALVTYVVMAGFRAFTRW